MLKVEHLKKEYRFGLLHQRAVTAVDDISFEIGPGETFGIVGESGSGKSTVAQCLTRLTEPTGGAVWYQGKNLLTLKNRELRQVRKKLQIVFQDPDGSLDPRMTIGESLAEALKLQGKTQNLEGQVQKMLFQVGLNPEHKNRYPHQMSGGQNQRVVVSRALSFEPELLIADEATASLDVSVQAQILELIRARQRECGFSVLLISHDMEIVRQLCDSVLVMYRGKAVEQGRTENVLQAPEHPYTRMLLACTEEHVEAWLRYLKKREGIAYENEKMGGIWDGSSSCRREFNRLWPYRNEDRGRQHSG